MKIYETSPTPSSKRVSLFLAEKGITVDRTQINVRQGDNLTEAFKALSVNGRVPVLELDNGTTICESVAICRYFEELYPDKVPLFGNTAIEKAQVEMWQRVVELQGLLVAFQAFRNISEIYSDREHCVGAWGDESRSRLIAFLPTLDLQLSKHSFVAGEHFSIADITAFILIGFLKNLDIDLADELTHITVWRDKIATRPAFQ